MLLLNLLSCKASLVFYSASVQIGKLKKNDLPVVCDRSDRTPPPLQVCPFTVVFLDVFFLTLLSSFLLQRWATRQQRAIISPKNLMVALSIDSMLYFL